MISDPETILHLLFGTMLPAMLGFLTLRAIKGVDVSIAELIADVKSQRAELTKLSVEMAELRVRVVHLELMMQRRDDH